VTSPAEEYTEDHLLNGRVALRQPRQGFRAGLDAVLLAAFIPAKPGETVLDWRGKMRRGQGLRHRLKKGMSPIWLWRADLAPWPMASPIRPIGRAARRHQAPFAALRRMRRGQVSRIGCGLWPPPLRRAAA